MISNEEIKAFLEGGDPEQFIVSIEFDYVTDAIYKIKEVPGQGKSIQKDHFIPFAWVGDLKGLNFYQKEKWNDFRLGFRVRYWDNPTQISIGLYLIFFKVWVVFYKI